MAAANFLAGSAWVKLYWNLSNFLAINVIGFRVTGSPVFDQALANSIGTDIKTAFTANLAAQYAPLSKLSRVGVRNWSSPNLPEFKDTGAVVSGTAATQSEPLPQNVAMCVTLRTALTGKSQTGRIYLGGWAEAAGDVNGYQSTAAGTAALNFMGAVKTALTARGLTMAVISRPAEHFVITKTTFHNDGTQTADTISDNRVKTGAITDVNAFEVRSPQWETQRRRVNGRGAVPALAGSEMILHV